MIMLSSVETWLLHSIVSIFLWVTFIGMIFVILGFGIYAVEKIMGKTSDNDKNDKDNKEDNSDVSGKRD